MAALTDEHGNANDMVLLDNASTDAVVDLLQKRFKNCKLELALDSNFYSTCTKTQDMFKKERGTRYTQ